MSKSANPSVTPRKARDAGPPLDAAALELFLKRATEAHSEGRFVEAERMYHHVLARNPDAHAAPYFLGLLEVEVGRLDLALDHFRYITRRAPRSFEAQFCLAYVLQELGRWSQALDGWRRVATLNPAAHEIQYKIVKVLEVLGRMDEAVVILNRLKAIPSQRLRAVMQISRLDPVLVADGELADLETRWKDEEAQVAARMGISFTLGNIYEKRGRYDEAFAAFALGNALRHENISLVVEEEYPIQIAPPSARIVLRPPAEVAAAHIESCATIRAAMTVPYIVARAGQGHASIAPIFIIGMPRSGSTLLEQILSSHAKVEGLGEAPALSQAIASGVRYDVAAQLAALDSARLHAMAENYLSRLRGLGWGKSPFVIDKLLGNYMNVGMIHLMFPQAKILHSMRDPVETCLGGFRQLFLTGNETTYSLSDIGAQYVRYRQMMDHWDEVLPGRVVHVSHEALVTDPDHEIRRLVTESCKLKWDENCLEFHRTKRAVRTASIAQVRKPIFKTSLQRWRKYEKHLGPLFDALGPYAPDL